MLVSTLAGVIGFPAAGLTKDNTDLQNSAFRALRLPVEGQFPSLTGATGWLNSEALTVAGLRGKVVLIDFWTYTCIYWLRTLPYVRAWAKTYKDHGLVVVGVHTPEFPFERDSANVRRETKKIGVSHPVAIDSDYAIWRAFHNRYWPARYLIDANGNIRHHHFGEGEYESSERAIRELLNEAGRTDLGSHTAAVETRPEELGADLDSLKSPETYVGYGRGENMASPGGPIPDRPRNYAVPARLRLNHWALAGSWTVKEGAVLSNGANGRIAYRFHARDLHLVLEPPSHTDAIRFRVTLDGAAPGEDRGIDIDAEGWSTVREPRLYQLIRLRRLVTDRTFEIEFFEPGVRAYAFTFG